MLTDTENFNVYGNF